MSNAHNKYRPDIDGLRCLAVLPVVLSHAKIPGFSGGFIGVDIFFVISGYLITGILMREIQAGEFSLLQFYERRARRILPALFVVLGTCICFGWLFYTPATYDQLAKSAIATLLFVSNIWFWHSTSDYFSSDAELEPLLHTWSLGVEEQFYIVFPILLLALASRSRKSIISAVVGLVLLSFIASIWATYRAPHANFFLAPTRVWELGLGSLLAMGMFSTKLRNVLLVELISLIGLIFIVSSVLLLTETTPFPGLAALPACVGAVAIIWAGSVQPTLVGRMLSSPIPVFFGLISYSLYLWHWPILVTARLWEGGLHIGPVLIFGVLGLSILFAWLSYRYVEQTFRVPTAKGGLSRERIFGLSFASGGLVLAICALIVWDNGAERRVSSETLAIMASATERSELEDRCRAMNPATGLCMLGDSESRPEDATILVWGDSHAAAMLPGFDAYFAEQGLVGQAAVKTSCAPLLGLIRVDRGRQHGCDDFNAAVLSYLKSHPKIDTVILAARWALNAEGTRARGEGGSPAVLASADSSSTAPTDNATLFRTGLFETVSALRAAGKTVRLVEGVPEIGFSVPTAWMNKNFMSNSAETMPLSWSEYEARHHLVTLVFDELVINHNVELIPIAKWLCRPDCQTEKDGELLYRDGDHLSIYAAKQLLPEVLAQQSESNSLSR